MTLRTWIGSWMHWAGPEKSMESASGDLLSLPCHPAPPPLTHDIRRIDAHYPDLKAFAKNLEDSVNESFFPNNVKNSYREVHVRLLSWEGGDALIYEQLQRLRNVFEEEYNFNTEEILIPAERSYHQLTGRLHTFIENHDAVNNLLIIYYGGHGSIDKDRHSLWMRDTSSTSPSVDWSSLQAQFQNGNYADVLIFLDCCAAAASARSAGLGMVEVIAASGFENKTPLTGQHTFTSNLIDELQDLLEDTPPKTIAAIHLHTNLLTRIKNWRPNRRLEVCVTPVYYYLAHRDRVRSIQIGPWRAPKEQTEEEEGEPVPVNLDIPRNRSIGSSSSASAPNRMISNLPESAFNEIWPDLSFKHDKVLLAINLSKDISQKLDITSFQEWLRDVPAFVDCVKIEAIYRSNSTLLVASMSIAVWNLLPDSTAATFIGFISSDNLKDLVVPKPLADSEIKLVEVPEAATTDSKVRPQAIPVSAIRQEVPKFAEIRVGEQQSPISDLGTTSHVREIERPEQAKEREQLKTKGSPPPDTVYATPQIETFYTRTRPSTPSSARNRLRKTHQQPIQNRRKSTYTYKALRSPDDIRLLRINRRSQGDPIECTLFHSSLPRSGDKRNDFNVPLHPYIALSYAWPDEDATCEVKIWGYSESENSSQNLSFLSNREGSLYIRPGLDTALRQIRSDFDDVVIWVDALCINMSDSKDMVAHMSRMHQIYNGAKEVLIWLGPGPSNNEAMPTFDFLEGILGDPNLKTFTTAHHTKEWQQVVEVMKSKIFSRRWFIQELAVARNSTVMMGRENMPWLDFADAISIVALHRQDIMRLLNLITVTDSSLRVEDLFSDIYVYRLINMTNQLIKKDKDGNIQCRLRPLEELVTCHFNDFENTNPRDTIYSLLAIAKDTSESEPQQYGLDEADGLARSLWGKTANRVRRGIAERRGFIERIRTLLLVGRSKRRVLDYVVAGSYILLLMIGIPIIFDFYWRLWILFRDLGYGFWAHGFNLPELKAVLLSKPLLRLIQEYIFLLILMVLDFAGTILEALPSDESSFKLDRRLSPNYEKSLTDVYVDFVDYCIETSKSLDILCRPWASVSEHWDSPASVISRLERSERLPSWICSISEHQFGDPGDLRAGQVHGESLVGYSLIQQRYNASSGLVPHATVGGVLHAVEVNAEEAIREYWKRFVRLLYGRRLNESDGILSVKGIRLGTVTRLSPPILEGVIPTEALGMGGWQGVSTRDKLPDQLWQTLVAGKDPNSQFAPHWYRRACIACLATTPGSTNSDLNIPRLREREQLLSPVDMFLERVQRVTWNRKFFHCRPTKGWAVDPMFGIGDVKTQEGDIVCILYGCSVPVVLRERPISNHRGFEFIGECYVNGMMDGEAITNPPPKYPYLSAETFNLE